MTIYPKLIEDAVSILESDSLFHQDTIVLGDNSSGKSFMLKKFVQNRLAQNNVYFIDAVNRCFIAKDVLKYSDLPQYSDKIIETRLQENYFNIQDSFNFLGTSTEKIERIYHHYEDRVQKFFCELTGDSFTILHGNQFGEVQFEKGRGLLSSGYQALVRLFLELIFYDELVVEGELTYAWIVIDEIDEFLSPKYAAKIYPFLKHHFKKMRFVFSTHSMDVILTAKNANLFILDDNGYEVLDVNDYNTFTETKRIFQRVFGKSGEHTSNFDSILRRLLNNRMNCAWTDADERKFEELGNEKLSPSQQLIFRQIAEWNK